MKKNFFKFYITYFWLSIIIVLIFLLLSYIGVQRIDPIYQSKSVIYINQVSSINTITSDSLEASQRLTDTFAQIITSYPVLIEVMKKINNQISITDLTNNISVNILKNTQLVEIRVKDTNPKRSQTINEAIITAFKTQVDELQQTTQQSKTDIQTVENSQVPDNPIYPKSFNILVMSALSGFILSLAIVGLIFHYSKKE